MVMGRSLGQRPTPVKIDFSISRMPHPALIDGTIPSMSSARPECGENCLEFLGREFWSWDDRNACSRSATRGHLECLRYAHEQGCNWSQTTCEHASRAGHLECLRYAHENGCPWNVITSRSACLEGHLECLRYAHEHDCPWDAWTGWCTTEYGHLECLRYCLENGCPSPDFTQGTIHPNLVPYLYHRGVRLLPSTNNSIFLRIHRREHIRRAWLLLRWMTALLGAYRRACDRVYSPDGIGYRQAEFSFHKAVDRENGATSSIHGSVTSISGLEDGYAEPVRIIARSWECPLGDPPQRPTT